MSSPSLSDAAIIAELVGRVLLEMDAMRSNHNERRQAQAEEEDEDDEDDDYEEEEEEEEDDDDYEEDYEEEEQEEEEEEAHQDPAPAAPHRHLIAASPKLASQRCDESVSTIQATTNQTLPPTRSSLCHHQGRSETSLQSCLFFVCADPTPSHHEGKGTDSSQAQEAQDYVLH